MVTNLVQSSTSATNAVYTVYTVYGTLYGLVYGLYTLKNDRIYKKSAYFATPLQVLWWDLLLSNKPHCCWNRRKQRAVATPELWR